MMIHSSLLLVFDDDDRVFLRSPPLLADIETIDQFHPSLPLAILPESIASPQKSETARARLRVIPKPREISHEERRRG